MADYPRFPATLPEAHTAVSARQANPGAVGGRVRTAAPNTSTFPTTAPWAPPAKAVAAEAVYSIAGDLEVLDGTLGYTLPLDAAVAAVVARVGTAPVGAGIVVDIIADGAATPVASVTIPDGDVTATTTVTDPTALTAGQVLTVNVTAVGSTTPGADLVVQVRF